MASALRAALAGAALLWLLSGCRTAPVQPPAGAGAERPWPEQRQNLEKLDAYGLAGRVAVAANGQGFSASLRYEQQPDASALSLDGPLGMGGLRVALNGDEVEIATSRGEKLDGVAARTELERRLGFALPLAELRWWLLGIPAPASASTVTADPVSGEISAFEQNGWQVSIQSRAAALGFALPQRLTAERAGARMKLIIDRWQP
jgi:outer membrane lipoprotein LolB